MATKRSVDIAIKARDDASRKFHKVSRATRGLTRALKGLGAAAIAYVGIRKLGGFLRSSGELYARQEAAVKGLSAALRLLGVDVKSVMGDMQKFASSIQKVTVHGDEAVLELMALGASMGKLSGEALQGATIAAIGLAKAYDLQLVAAMRLVARAAVGDTASLTRYGITLGKGLTAQEKFNKVLKIGTNNFGLAQAEIRTTRGQVHQLSNAWGDFKESIIEAFAESRLFALLREATFLVQNLRLIWANLGDQIVLVGLTAVEDVKHSFTKVIPQHLKNFVDGLKIFFRNVWEFTKTVFTNMFKNAVDFFKATWSWLKGEGMDWKWTGLLEGFEETMVELPKIARRHLTELEKELAATIAGRKVALAAAQAARFAGGFDAGQFAAGPVGTAPAKKKTTDVPSLGARESRFLTMAPGRRDPGIDTARNTKEISVATKATVRLLESIDKSFASFGLGPANVFETAMT